MPPKTIFFTGAPLPSDLQPDAVSDKLLTSFSSSIARFAGLQGQALAALPPSAATQTAAPAPWHSLTLKGEHLATRFSQIREWQEEYRGNAAYFATEDPTFLGSQSETSFYRSSWERGSQWSAQELLEDGASQFYEHSLALHNDLPSSQIAPAPSGDKSADESCYSTSFNTTQFTSTLDQDSIIGTTSKNPIPNAGQITNLDRLPNENYLKSISPQTMSVSIVCGIISISPPRTINTRHGSTVEIVEMLVGDDHKSGFGINFWLPSIKAPSALRTALTDLRPQDIILVRNMALSSFKGKVYGQSLRKEMTKVDLLLRNRIDRTDRAGCYSRKDFVGEEAEMHPQVLKTKRVRDWVLRFVGGGTRAAVVRDGCNGMGKKGLKRRAEVAGIGIGDMPPDTQ